MKYKKHNKKLITAVSSILGFAVVNANAFTFDSGSTGTEDYIKTCSTPTTFIIDAGQSGVLHYKSFSVGTDCTVKFTPTGNSNVNKSNPIRLLVKENVVIDGVLDLTGSNGQDGIVNTSVNGGVGGPGGFDGGFSGTTVSPSQGGFGPGGRPGVTANSSSQGSAGVFSPNITSPIFQPLIGGSGGSGIGFYSVGQYSGGGGGGGGAILIAATGTVTINGHINTKFGSGGSSSLGLGGSGASGMSHIIANNISGSGTFTSTESIFETNVNQSSFTVNGYPQSMTLKRISLDITQNPTISIVSVGGTDVTALNELVLPNSGDTAIVIDSTGLPENTGITVKLAGEVTTNVSTTASLDANGDASVSLSIPTGQTQIVVYVSTPVTTLASIPNYRNEKIKFARIESQLGGQTQLKFFTESGKAVPQGFVKKPWSFVKLG